MEEAAGDQSSQQSDGPSAPAGTDALPDCVWGHVVAHQGSGVAALRLCCRAMRDTVDHSVTTLTASPWARSWGCLEGDDGAGAEVRDCGLAAHDLEHGGPGHALLPRLPAVRRLHLVAAPSRFLGLKVLSALLRLGVPRLPCGTAGIQELCAPSADFALGPSTASLVASTMVGLTALAVNLANDDFYDPRREPLAWPSALGALPLTLRRLVITSNLVGPAQLEALSRLTGLEELSVQNIDQCEELPALRHLHLLRHLDLGSSGCSYWSRNNLPAPITSLTRLTSLVATSASAAYLPLEALTPLQELKVGKLTHRTCEDVLSGLPHLRTLEVGELSTDGVPAPGPLDDALRAAGWVDPWAKRRTARRQAQPSSSGRTGADGTEGGSNGSGSDGDPDPMGSATGAGGRGMGLPPLSGMTSLVVRSIDLPSLVGLPSLVDPSALRHLHLPVSCKWWNNVMEDALEALLEGMARITFHSEYEVKMTAALSQVRLLDVVGPLLCHFTCLRTLSLDLQCKGYTGTVHPPPRTPQGTFVHVAQRLAPNLTDLSVYESPGSDWGWVTDEGLEVLGGAGVLRRLQLWHSGAVTLQGLRHLMAGSPRFRRICLRGGFVEEGEVWEAAEELGWTGEVEVVEVDDL